MNIIILFTISQYYFNLIVWKHIYKTQENHIFDFTGPLRVFRYTLLKSVCACVCACLRVCVDLARNSAWLVKRKGRGVMFKSP